MAIRKILFSLVLLLTAYGAMAQQRHEFSPERYKQKLEEFVTQQAGLSTEEAQKLFPMLHEMLGRQRKNNDAARSAMRSCGEGASEEDYEQAVEKVLQLDMENKRIEQEYYRKFHTVLSWKKIHALRVALWKFQMEALRRFTPHQPQHRHKKP